MHGVTQITFRLDVHPEMKRPPAKRIEPTILEVFLHPPLSKFGGEWFSHRGKSSFRNSFVAVSNKARVVKALVEYFKSAWGVCRMLLIDLARG